MLQLQAMLNLSLTVLLVLSIHNVGSQATTLALYNKCKQTVWPGIQPSAGRPVLARGGFRLLPNQAYSIRLPAGWSGRIWGRQDCSFDPATGRGHCATGDCGGTLYCNGAGGAPPATLAEITIGEQDFYDVSLVDGYNLAISMTPFRGKGKCGYAGCVSDLNEVCPAGLAVRSGERRAASPESMRESGFAVVGARQLEQIKERKWAGGDGEG
ncbi:hypothetical protein J5N97_002837 [Dioscorea zingiberensis]|uniref:Thaumatin-like protein n=1 Tax=Dioscorea zingiberensis TaxID=325984 RepID=A0A9D5HQ02_9LILI|nr:hypothetical protein J5N97_002837 [Dioscorea zingiberensis]